MEKPLYRWTVGGCLQQGLDILAESIEITTKTLGIDTFDWMICYNGLTSDNIEFLKKAIGDKPVELVAQDWKNCAIPDTCKSPRRSDGSYEWDGRRCGGTLWKVSPARMRLNSHEIVADNDVIILKQIPAIEEFLNSKDKVLILEEPIRFYGRYEKYFEDRKPPYLNSGFMGFCPGFDFGKAIRTVWESHKEFNTEAQEETPLFNLTQADEQGLLMLTLKQYPNLRINKSFVKEILAQDRNAVVDGTEYAIHFTQGNRLPRHLGWIQYNAIKENHMMF